MAKTLKNGADMHDLATRLFKICRSLTGDGVRQTLNIVKEYIPELNIHEVPTGTKAYDWQVPEEWNINGGYIENENGERIVDFAENNLHVMGYSIPTDEWLSKEELLKHIYVADHLPDAIPYVTSYYDKRWGFCMSKNMRDTLPDGKYHAVINSTLERGNLTYADAVLKGESEKEILISTYICHPSMANNELSGPCLATALYNYLSGLKSRRYTYRFVFVPETIGSIVYISRNFDTLKNNVIAGYILTCVGDNKAYSYVPTKRGNTLADKAALCVLNSFAPNFDAYTYLERGSDERQYNAAGVNMPVCSVFRSKYHLFEEYHTSFDNLDFISAEGFDGSFELYKHIFTALEYNKKYKMTCKCEPRLGKRGLYPTVSSRNSSKEVANLTNFIAYADGEEDLIDISNRIKVPIWELVEIIEKLTKHELLVS